MIEGAESGAGSGAESGSIPLTNMDSDPDPGGQKTYSNTGALASCHFPPSNVVLCNICGIRYYSTLYFSIILLSQYTVQPYPNFCVKF
jgi:hypothetical protein